MHRLTVTLAVLATAGSLSLTVPARAQESQAAAIEACMREMRSGLKAGQKLTEQQRMVAETQCRARVEQAQPPKR